MRILDTSHSEVVRKQPRALQSLVLFALSSVALASGCGSSHASPRSGIVVSAEGRIGPLWVDRSDRAAVLSLMGRAPDAERRGRPPQSPPGPVYDALGYGCHKRYSAGSFQLRFPHSPYCRTIFWIDAASGKLETFYTSERRFIEAHRVLVGMPTAVASRLLHTPVFVGCGEGVYLSSKRAMLTIEFSGGVQRGPKLHIVGGRVAELVLHSRRRDAGVFDCL